MAIELNSLLMDIPGATGFVRQRDGWWMAAPSLDVVAAARRIQELGGRLSTITAAALPGGESEVIYHYFLDCQVFNVKVITHENALPSISSLLPAADWIEREISDLYRVTFTGHPHPERLIRPAQLEAGLFREPGGEAGKNSRR